MPESHTPPRRYRPPAAERHYDTGYDNAMASVLFQLKQMQDDGATDADMLAAVVDLAHLRLRLSLREPRRAADGGSPVTTPDPAPASRRQHGRARPVPARFLHRIPMNDHLGAVLESRVVAIEEVLSARTGAGSSWAAAWPVTCGQAWSSTPGTARELAGPPNPIRHRHLGSPVTAAGHPAPPAASVADGGFAQPLSRDDAVWLLTWLGQQDPALVGRGLCAWPGGALAPLSGRPSAVSGCAGTQKARRRERGYPAGLTCPAGARAAPGAVRALSSHPVNPEETSEDLHRLRREQVAGSRCRMGSITTAAPAARSMAAGGGRRTRSAYAGRERLRQIRNRAAVFGHYGEACACCGASSGLTIDHANGGGKEHRAEIGGGSTAMYRWLVRNGFPDGFQTLCRPCNISKSDGARCRLYHAPDGAQ